MSLDVTLFSEAKLERAPTTGVFVHDNGRTRELTESEVLEKWPNWEPPVVELEPSYAVFSYNITHNLGKMADAAGIYTELWRPEEAGITKAHQLIAPLRKGLDRLLDTPDYFKTFDPPNKWGNYDGLVRFVESYLSACIEHPNATVYADR